MSNEVEKEDNGAAPDGGSIELAGQSGVALSPAAEALRAQAMATVQARVAMAVARPRNVLAFRARLLKECERPAFADAAIYSKPVGGKNQEGPSIRFAEACLRFYGNLLVSVEAIASDERGVQLRCTATDLEVNSTDIQDLFVNRTVERKDPAGRIPISTRRNSRGEPTHLLEATDDEMLTELNKASSKLRRNRIISMIPADIVEDAMKVCNKVCSDRDAKDPMAELKKLVDAFSAIGVSPVEIKDYLGHDVEKVTPKEVADLRAVYNGLRGGEATWGEAMASRGKGLNVPAAETKGGSKSDRMASEMGAKK